MPDEATLLRMYGPEYASIGDPAASVDDPRDSQLLGRWLRNRPPGTFIDFGCGQGQLLEQARSLGWSAIGVELSPAVAAATAARTGLTVVSDPQSFKAPVADVLNLGDVLEHLTDMDRQFPQILQLLKPGGLFLAQGPLEENRNLFLLGLKAARRLRPRRMEMAPYHVILATAKGQSELFRRFGLQTLEYRVSEVSWPAPSRLSAYDLRSPKKIALFGLRRISQRVSDVTSGLWGNRYAFAGLMPATMAHVG